MNKRDLRALMVLAVWAAALASYFGIKSYRAFQSDQRALKLKLGGLTRSRETLEAGRRRMAADRNGAELTFPKDWHLETADHLRLKGEDGILAAVSGVGLKNGRVEVKGIKSAYGIRQIVWRVEGEGTLREWVEATHKIEISQPFMSITGFELTLVGDPWSPSDGDGEGPPLKGTVDCSWIVGP